VKGKGFYLSFETIVSMALLGLLLALPMQIEQPSLNDLHLFKKENDLLLLWVKRQGLLSEEQMVEEFKFAFPGKSGEIFLDGKKLEIGKEGREAVASKAVFFDGFGKKHEIGLTVFKQDFS